MAAIFLPNAITYPVWSVHKYCASTTTNTTPTPPLVTRVPSALQHLYWRGLGNSDADSRIERFQSARQELGYKKLWIHWHIKRHTWVFLRIKVTGSLKELMFSGCSDTDKTSDSIRPTSSSVLGLFLNLVVNFQMSKERKKDKSRTKLFHIYLIVNAIWNKKIPLNDQIETTKILNSSMITRDRNL